MSNSFLQNIFSIKNDFCHKIITILGIKFKIKKDKNKVLDERICDLECAQILESGLWDSSYYLKNFDNENINKYFALRHYLKEGWKKGFNPSAVFDGNDYLTRYPDIKINPILFFLNKGRFVYYDVFKTNKYPSTEQSIKEYLVYKKSRVSKKVVYTCITDDYDDIEEIKGYKYINSEWDYICYTDNQDYINRGQVGIWQIRPLAYDKLDGTRNNRWHKINPHEILSDYDESLYIDANINILTDKIFREIDNLEKDLILSVHACNVCMYKEFIWAINDNVDNLELINKQLDLIKSENFPKNYGMPENNIIYRKHNKEHIVSLMKDWWYMLENYAKRDQLSFPYILWKHNIKVEDCALFDNTRVDYKNFCTFIHKAKRQ